MRSGASGLVEFNSSDAPAELFVDAPGGDMHLRPSATAAIDQGVAVDNSGVDIDHEIHRAGSAPDLGADGYNP